METYFICLLAAFLASPKDAPTEDAIAFDSRLSFPFRDVTPEQFRQKNPALHVVEVTLRITSTLSVKEDSVDSLVYLVEFPAGIDIADFLPKTELGSELAGPIDASGNRTTTGAIRVAVEGKASARYLNIASASFTGEVEAKSTDSASSGVHVRLLPPKQVVMSAGTQSNGRALQFKLRPYNQITLEGEREFVALLAVPADWKGTCVVLKCVGRLKGFRSPYVRDVKVALYPDADSKARAELEVEAIKYKPKSAQTVQRESLVGAWEGNWKHTRFGEGRMACSIGDSGEFSGTLYKGDGGTIGYFKGR